MRGLSDESSLPMPTLSQYMCLAYSGTEGFRLGFCERKIRSHVGGLCKVKKR